MPPDPKGEFLFDVPLYLLNLLVAVNRIRDAQQEKLLRPLGLNVTRFRTLIVIWRLRACSMSELATMSASDRTSLTRTVDQLVSEGLVERAGEAGDRRKVRLLITPGGKAITRQAVALVDQEHARTLSAIPEETQRAMVRGLETMLVNLGATDEMLKVLAPRHPDQGLW
jgi:DNA-binding MarR family transcriptional regulator